MVGLGWRSLTPPVSIAVFVLVALLTIDVSGDWPIGAALVAGVVLGPPLAFLMDRRWPRAPRGDDATAGGGPSASSTSSAGEWSLLGWVWRSRARLRSGSRTGLLSLGLLGAVGALVAGLVIFVFAGDGARHPTFTEVSGEAGIVYVQHSPRASGSCVIDVLRFCETDRMTGGAAAADYDGDGWVDLYVTRLDGTDLLFRNQGDGSFAESSEASGLAGFELASNGAAWGDLDNDGDADLFVTTLGDDRFHLFINDGEGGFTEEALPRGAAVPSDQPRFGFSVALGDYDRDGWLDIHTTEWGSHPFLEGAPAHARLLRNRGADQPGHFEDVTEAAGVALDEVISQTGFENRRGAFAFGSAFVDLDLDGWQDLAVVSDFGKTRLYWNNGDGTFRDGTLAAGVGSDENGMGAAFGDYDGDGDLDWFVSAIHDAEATCAEFAGDAFSALGVAPACYWGGSGNRLYENEGGRRFSDATESAGVRAGGWGWGAAFLDFDNDADLDLVMTNGQTASQESPSDQYADDPVRLWVNEGTAAPMRDAAAATGLSGTGPGKGLLTFDYDRDGDLDVFIVNNGGTPTLWRNDGGDATPWLRVDLEGVRSNRDGIGARVIVEIGEGGPALVREVGVGSHFLGQGELTSHFGLGEGTTSVARVTVIWPASGTETVLEAVAINTTVVVREESAGVADVAGELPAGGSERGLWSTGTS